SVFLLLKKLTLLMRFTGISGILYRNKWYTLPELMVHFNGIVVQYGMEYPVCCLNYTFSEIFEFLYKKLLC
ncbi:hypothetical protein, partial [Myroides odoratimimus]|uniref:hypothetical protein n=1 Tax=Myroides odoratimimus TaxID=76832 RepID=UPI0025774E95